MQNRLRNSNVLSSSFYAPGSVTRIPELVQVLAVTLGVHGVPEASMLANTQFAIPREPHERIALQNAPLFVADVAEKIPPEKEIPSIDPVIGKFRFLGKFDNLVVIQLQFAEARGRVDAEHGTDFFLREVKAKLLAQIHVSHAIAVGDCEVLGVAQIFLCSARYPTPGHRQGARVSKRNGPILLVIDFMDLYVVRLQFDREIAVHGWIIEKIGFDDIGFVAEAKDEFLKSVMRICPHDVPKDGIVSYRDHRLGADVGLLAQTGTKPTAKDKDGDVRRAQFWTSFMEPGFVNPAGPATKLGLSTQYRAKYTVWQLPMPAD
jgi:hypothetical protein